MKTGQDFLDLAATRIGEEYIYGANVDLDDPDWHGPWDCAEFVSWVTKQLTGKTLGCVDNGDTDDPDPYTGGWKKDVMAGVVKLITVAKAIKTPGAILLRFREGGKHIVFSVGDWTTVEAKSTLYGVCRGKVGNVTLWDYGILIPGVEYGEMV
jgi:N-acetylmuramoyl-L-alanine amidase